MKKMIVPMVLIAAFLMTTVSFAQINTPAPSPLASMTQKVGLIDVMVEYSRPSMKDREIFGSLVPYDQAWRTGANKNTMIEFSGDVKFGGVEVKAGKYAIFTIPGENEWTLMLYTNTENWGTPEKIDPTLVAAEVKAEPQSTDFTFETFTINFDHLRNSSAHLQLMWENTVVTVLVETNTDASVEADIKRIMSGPTQADYYAAARYYFESGKDINQAAEWIKKANENDPKYWMVRVESLIHAEMGNVDKAIAAAKQSLALAEKAGNQNFIKMNTESIAEWTAMKKKK